MAHLGTVNSQPLHPPSEPSQEPAAPPPPPGPPVRPSRGWYSEPFETREVRKARERADRAARRADRAARRVQEARGAERAGQRSGARQLVDAAGDAATAALTAVSAAADEAQARLAAKARMRELEHAVVTARAGGPVDVSPPTRDEALKLARPGGSRLVRGVVRPGRRVHRCRDRGARDDDDRRVRLAGRCRAAGHPHRRWLAGRPSPDGGPEPQGRSDPARARARQPRFRPNVLEVSRSAQAADVGAPAVGAPTAATHQPNGRG